MGRNSVRMRAHRLGRAQSSGVRWSSQDASCAQTLILSPHPSNLDFGLWRSPHREAFNTMHATSISILTEDTCRLPQRQVTPPV